MSWGAFPVACRAEESLRFASKSVNLGRRAGALGNFAVEKRRRSPYRTDICLPGVFLQIARRERQNLSPPVPVVSGKASGNMLLV
jgi:hypothetical protein